MSEYLAFQGRWRTKLQEDLCCGQFQMGLCTIEPNYGMQINIQIHCNDNVVPCTNKSQQMIIVLFISLFLSFTVKASPAFIFHRKFIQETIFITPQQETDKLSCQTVTYTPTNVPI